MSAEALEKQIAWAVDNVPRDHELRSVIDRIVAGEREGYDLAVLDALWEGYQIATDQLEALP